MIGRAKLTLDSDYCTERLAVLEDESAAETQSFIKAYGVDYHKQVVTWFHQTLSEV